MDLDSILEQFEYTLNPKFEGYPIEGIRRLVQLTKTKFKSEFVCFICMENQLFHSNPKIPNEVALHEAQMLIHLLENSEASPIISYKNTLAKITEGSGFNLKLNSISCFKELLIERMLWIKMFVGNSLTGFLVISFSWEKPIEDEEFLNSIKLSSCLAYVTFLNMLKSEEIQYYRENNFYFEKSIMTYDYINSITHNMVNNLLVLQNRLIIIESELASSRKKLDLLYTIIESIPHLKEGLNSLGYKLKLLRNLKAHSEESYFTYSQISTIIDRSIEMISRSSYRKEIKVSSRIEKDLKLYIDEDKLLKAILNLLTFLFGNLRKKSQILIITKLDIRKDWFKIKLMFTGLEMNYWNRKELHNSIKAVTKGINGNGLHFSRYIIEHLHNGILTFESLNNRWSSFNISLPIRNN